VLAALTASADRASLFFSFLGLVAGAFVVITVVLAVVGRFSAGARELGRSLRDQVGPVALPLAAAVAITCTFGSLWFSEVEHFQPCRLCWFQRTAMYPLSVITLVAAVRRDRGVKWYVVPVALIGMAISTYHYLIEWYPNLESTSCEPSVPCTYVWFRRFGFVSLPYLAFSGFAAIITLVLLATPPPAASTSQELP
jgi:disulfide bond formation protein DsbB